MADGWLIVELVCTDFLAVLSITKLLLFLTGKVIGPERRILCAIITSAVGLIILSGLPLPRNPSRNLRFLDGKIAGS